MQLLFGGDNPLLGGPGYIDPMSIIAIFAAVFGITMVVRGPAAVAHAREASVHRRRRTARPVRRCAGPPRRAPARRSRWSPRSSRSRSSELVVVRQLGVGVAIAILLDALIVRPVLLPAAVEVLGRRGWWPTSRRRAGTAPGAPAEPEPAGARARDPPDRGSAGMSAPATTTGTAAAAPNGAVPGGATSGSTASSSGPARPPARSARLDQEAVDRIVWAMVVAGLEHAVELAELAMEETGFGVLEDKVVKNYIATEFLYDYLKDKRSVGVIDEDPSAGSTTSPSRSASCSRCCRSPTRPRRRCSSRSSRPRRATRSSSAPPRARRAARARAIELLQEAGERGGPAARRAAGRSPTRRSRSRSTSSTTPAST